MNDAIKKESLPNYYTSQDVRVLRMLRASRLSAGISQKELSVIMGCSQSLVGKIERGAALSWLRYVPKINKWIDGCGGVLTFGVKILREPGVKNPKGRKCHYLKGSKQKKV